MNFHRFGTQGAARYLILVTWGERTPKRCCKNVAVEWNFQALQLTKVAERSRPMPYLSQARAEVLDELHQILHAVDDLSHGQVVQHPLTLHDDLPHLGLVETQQERRGALQDPARAVN